MIINDLKINGFDYKILLYSNNTLVYHCGSDDGWSAVYTFNSIRDGSDWSPRFAVFGDMGNVNAKSIPRLQKDVEKNLYDAILHVGMNQIEA